MERIISEEDRIRRAEEISARRKNRIPIDTININRKPKMSLLSKVFIQVIVSICIFGIIYFLNQNNSFAVEKIKPIISRDTDFVGIYNQIDEFVKNVGNSISSEKNSNENNTLENNVANEENNTTQDNNAENSNQLESNNRRYKQ